MRRNREWWGRLTPEERYHVWNYERNSRKGGRSPYLPDDCSDCGVCGTPCLGSGPCGWCGRRYDAALKKVNI